MDDGKERLIKHCIKRVLADHIGKNNKILRNDLRVQIKLEYKYISENELRISDRAMRNYLEDLRATDIFCSRICAATGDGGGYWLARSRAELMENMGIDKRRLMNTYRRIRGQRINSVVAFASNDFEALKQIELFNYGR